MPAILAFLLLWGCIPTTDIRINDDAIYPGYYHYFGDWIEVRSNTPSYVLAHELAHSCGANEQQAHKIELLWREYEN